MDGELLVDGQPVACGTCGDTLSLTAAVTRIPVASWPAWVNCRAGHGEEHPRLTNGMVAAIIAAAPVRTRATDREDFNVVVDGHQVVGELYPTWCLDDFRRGAQVLYRRGLKPTFRRKVRKARRAAADAAQSAAHGVADAVVYAPYAAALGTAWNARTGIADPATAPIANPCPSCKGKGALRLNTRVHTSPTVPCALCAGTGRADTI